MTAVSQAVILMAGSGSRLRGSDETLLKPLVPVAGRPLICYTMEALSQAGIRKVNFVVGYQHERMIAAMTSLVPKELEFRFIENSHWQKQNGVSLLAAAKCLTTPFLLAMGDHLFENSMIDMILRAANRAELNVAIDRKIDSIIDLADAMKVQTHGERIIAIGKDLRHYNAVDAGLFVCPPTIFAYLERAKRNGDCSLADGVRGMAVDGLARAVDIGNASWQDVDTPNLLDRATEMMQAAHGVKFFPSNIA